MRIRLTKNVMIAGERHDAGGVIETDDSHLVNILVGGGKGAPATKADAARLRETSIATWSKGTASEAARHDPRWITR